MQMGVTPTHDGLQGAMEIAERNFPPHQDPSPNRWPGFKKRHSEDVDFHEETEKLTDDEQIVACLTSWRFADLKFCAIPRPFPSFRVRGQNH
jgi:hypothetical protein